MCICISSIFGVHIILVLVGAFVHMVGGPFVGWWAGWLAGWWVPVLDRSLASSIARSTPNDENFQHTSFATRERHQRDRLRDICTKTFWCRLQGCDFPSRVLLQARVGRTAGIYIFSLPPSLLGCQGSLTLTAATSVPHRSATQQVRHPPSPPAHAAACPSYGCPSDRPQSSTPAP